MQSPKPENRNKVVCKVSTRELGADRLKMEKSSVAVQKPSAEEAKVVVCNRPEDAYLWLSSSCALTAVKCAKFWGEHHNSNCFRQPEPILWHRRGLEEQQNGAKNTAQRTKAWFVALQSTVKNALALWIFTWCKNDAKHGSTRELPKWECCAPQYKDPF